MKGFWRSHFLAIIAFSSAIFLSSCSGAVNGSNPQSGVQPLPELTNTLPDTTVNSFDAITAYRVIYPFQGGLDGANAATQIVFDPQGNAYGTTVQGGNAGCGTVFRLHKLSSGQWQEAVLHSFNCFAGGKNPHGGVVLDAQGNLYGTTVAGGVSGGCTGDGCGIIFKIGTGGNETVLYTFQGGNDGFGPGSPLAFDGNGNLYGTAPDGGRYGHGVVFELQSVSGSWQYKVIHQFTGGNDGSTGSLGPLFVDERGGLYGVTELGGAHQAGIAYRMKRISATSWSFSPLYAFKGQPDGAFPYGGLVEVGENLFGTTYFGGTAGNGTVFELTRGTTGYTEHVVYSFKGGSDGSLPTTTLLLGPNSALYGTTSTGGRTTCDCGTVFSLAQGTFAESILHRFGALQDGKNPYYGLTQFGTSLFSSTVAGGASGNGTIFSITP